MLNFRILQYSKAVALANSTWRQPELAALRTSPACCRTGPAGSVRAVVLRTEPWEDPKPTRFCYCRRIVFCCFLMQSNSAAGSPGLHRCLSIRKVKLWVVRTMPVSLSWGWSSRPEAVLFSTGGQVGGLSLQSDCFCASEQDFRLAVSRRLWRGDREARETVRKGGQRVRAPCSALGSGADTPNLSHGGWSVLHFLWFNVLHLPSCCRQDDCERCLDGDCSDVSGHRAHKVNLKSEPHENALLVCVTRCFTLTFLLKITVFKKRRYLHESWNPLRLSCFGKIIECTDCNTKIYLFLEYQ